MGFTAVSAASARVLILGSLPGAMSLAHRQYYAKPQNSFWRIMGSLFSAGPDLPYERRLAVLRQVGVALWDVCASAHRSGSLDSDIKHHAANDFESYYAAHTNLRLLCFNGQKAASLYASSVLPNLPPALQSLRSVVLPSTSPANAACRYEEKLRLWSDALSVIAACSAPSPPKVDPHR